MIQNRDDLIWKPFYLEKSIIEKSLLEWLQYEEPEAFLAKFTALFVEGNHEDSRVTQALEKVLFAPQEQQKFSQLIDYCCHLIIDRWLHNPESCQFIPKLIELFDLIKPQTKSYARLKGRLIQANKKYKETELYNRLEFIVKIITNEKTTFDLSEQMFVRDLVTKYHFLYRYFLREEISLDNEHKFILNKAKEKQQQFEFQLYKYVLYRTRLLQLARARQFSQGAGKVIRRIDNPTLLSDKDLKLAVDIYSSNFDCEYTLMQMAHKLLANNQHHSYGQFKQDLYRYLLLKIDFKNNDYPLNFYLKQKLEQIFPQSDKRPLNDSLILQTARQLLSFLMVEGDRTQVEPVRFMESIAHLGTAQTIMLLIKIVSICPQVKPDLELRLAMLFIHYQNDRVQDVLWLVKSLEHISVALGICFGKMDLSATKII